MKSQGTFSPKGETWTWSLDVNNPVKPEDPVSDDDRDDAASDDEDGEGGVASPRVVLKEEAMAELDPAVKKNTRANAVVASVATPNKTKFSPVRLHQAVAPNPSPLRFTSS